MKDKTFEQECAEGRFAISDIAKSGALHKKAGKSATKSTFN